MNLKLAFRFGLAGLLLAAALAPQAGAAGPFQPTWNSLTKYRCPEWFRDAKFGIWAHWGPQCVPMVGDWYARNMYVQGAFRGQYDYHVKTYGHPSKFGYTACDIRFTSKGPTLYAVALGWPPEGKLRIKSLAKPGAGEGNRIDRVELLGHVGPLASEQTAEALLVTLPAKPLSPIACTLRITGRNLRPATTAGGK